MLQAWLLRSYGTYLKTKFWLSQFSCDSQQGRLRTTSILVRAFWNFKCKVLKYSRNCSHHNTLIPNLVKPLNYIPMLSLLMKSIKKSGTDCVEVLRYIFPLSVCTWYLSFSKPSVFQTLKKTKLWSTWFFFLVWTWYFCLRNSSVK